ncbi:DUF3127 domain-containing protein [bacterium]|nr:DUF3127 domain-containing protein [bacterium]
MELKVTGKITKILPPQSGTSKAGTTWTKQLFLVDNGETYNSLFCFELFKDDKVQKFNQYNKVGDHVDVEFNVNCNEYQGKYYTSLQAWKVSHAEGTGQAVATPTSIEAEEDAPF